MTRIIFIKPSKDAVVFDSDATTASELSNELVGKKYVTQADFEGKKLYEALSQTEMNGGNSTLPQPKNYKYQGVEAESLIFSLREKDVDKKIKSGNTDFDVVSIVNGIAEKYDELGNLFRELATALGNQKTQASGLPADVDLFGNEDDPYFTGEEEDEEAAEEDEDYDD